MLYSYKQNRDIFNWRLLSFKVICRLLKVKVLSFEYVLLLPMTYFAPSYLALLMSSSNTAGLGRIVLPFRMLPAAGKNFNRAKKKFKKNADAGLVVVSGCTNQTYSIFCEECPQNKKKQSKCI